MNAARALGERHARMGIARPPVHLTPEQRREWRAGWYGFTDAPKQPIREKRWSPSPIKSAGSSAISAPKG